MTQISQIHFEIQQLEQLCDHLSKSFQGSDDEAASGFGVVASRLADIGSKLDSADLPQSGEGVTNAEN